MTARRCCMRAYWETEAHYRGQVDVLFLGDFTFTALHPCIVITLAMTGQNNKSWLFCIFCNKLLSNWSGWFITSHWVIMRSQATVSYWTSEVGGGGGGKTQMLVYQFEIVQVFSARESEPTVSFMKHKNFVSIVSATKYDEKGIRQTFYHLLIASCKLFTDCVYVLYW